MHDLIKQLTLNQMEAALCTLNACLTRCPAALWNARVGELMVNQVLFHALFFADYYLGPGEAKEPFQQQPFHSAESAAFRDYEELEPRRQVHQYDRAFLERYVAHCRQKAIDVITAETAESLVGPPGFSWRNCSRAELHLYNMRHVQHHAAQVSIILRREAGIDIPWVSHGWKELPAGVSKTH